MAQFVQTHRGGKALLYEGYKYLKIRDGKECTFWRCERHKNQCSARVTTYEGSVQSSRGEHNHPPDLAVEQCSVYRTLVIEQYSVFTYSFVHVKINS